MLHNPPVAAAREARNPPRFVGLACLLLALGFAALLAGCQGEARTTADCDQLLNEEKYGDVISKCDDPYHVSSAYLGLGGFDTFLLINSTSADGKVAVLLELTAANVDTKRGYFNKALEVVNPPHGGSQAFALLVASFLGLAVTTDQYLDNGMGGGGAVALDDDIAAGEITSAITFAGSTPFGATVLSSPQQYSIQYGGKSYVIDCNAATIPCGSDATAEIYDDADGSGRMVTGGGESADAVTIRSDMASVTLGALVVQLADVGTLTTLSAATREPATSYLGRNTAPVTFDIGLSNYLTALNRANDELVAATGSTGGSDLTDQVNAITSKLDNGGTCSGTNVPFEELAGVYNAASGTFSRPAGSNFAGRNLVASSAVTNVWDQGSLGPPAFPPITPGDLQFTATYYKVLYPTVSALVAFDVTNATPRVDQTFANFQIRFEDVWLLAPGGSPAGDNAVNIAEVLCSNDS